VEGVLGRSQKIILDTKPSGGGGNLIYLPLDRLVERRASVSVQPTAAPAGTADADSAAGGSDMRQRGER
ncbi:MAG: hypothetical protein NZM12_01875, partial [Steroidobacteraceae bacterium]|nr:hypothetical protein [Steroidobacteraceae bacterium]MDW8260390.1 hypothetical protein [Gammaproteobacteria bacterium]